MFITVVHAIRQKHLQVLHVSPLSLSTFNVSNTWPLFLSFSVMFPVIVNIAVIKMNVILTFLRWSSTAYSTYDERHKNSFNERSCTSLKTLIFISWLLYTLTSTLQLLIVVYLTVRKSWFAMINVSYHWEVPDTRDINVCQFISSNNFKYRRSPSFRMVQTALYERYPLQCNLQHGLSQSYRYWSRRSAWQSLVWSHSIDIVSRSF